MCLALQFNTNDKWDKSNTCVRLLQKLVPLPGKLEYSVHVQEAKQLVIIICDLGFTLFIGEKKDMAEGDNAAKLTNLVKEQKFLFVITMY